MYKSKILCLAVAGAMIATACTDKKSESGEVTSFNADYLDSTARPEDDFYQFANGLWLKNNPVPASESRWGSFNEVSERNNENIKTLLEEASKKGGDKGSVTQMVGDFYATIMDSTKRDADGIKPIQGELDRAKALTKETVADLVAWQHQHGMGSLFSFSVQEDLKDNTKYAIYIGQTGLGLPDKEYYFKKDSASVALRGEYAKYVAKLFELAGTPSPTVGTTQLALETKLASASMNAVEQRNIDAQYNKYTYADFKKLCPAFNWDKYFANIGVKQLDTIIVGQPAYMKNLNTLLTAGSLEDWKNYFTFEALAANADRLSSNFEEAEFGFYNQYMRGAKEMKPRWKRAINSFGGTMGDVLGRAFVEKNFSEEAKKRVEEMVDNLQASLKVRLQNLPWMSDSTKAKAMEKMASFTRKMAFPSKWKNTDALKVGRNSYAENAMAAANFDFNYMVAKLGQPIDKTEWGMGAHIVNAYYNPVQNEICFPAGILQPPFFDPKAEDAVNYARMGAVIGHEMIHGFDDQGAQFDAKGLFKMWWTQDDFKKFSEKTGALVNQYNAYMPIAGDSTTRVNGQLTLGENIADFGGLTVAYYAYMKSLEGKKTDTILGYTPEQRFFISFAQIWKNNATDKFLQTQVATDPHSPAKFRVNGTLSNMPEFFKAFNIKEGAKMRNSADKVVAIW